MVTLTPDEIDYLRKVGFKPTDPLSKGLIEARRVEFRLAENAKNLEIGLESAGSKIAEQLISSNDRIMADYARNLNRAIFCYVIGGVSIIALSLFIVSGMIADFRTDRNAGVDLASRFHMAPNELIKALSFIEKTEYSDPGFWQWVQSDGQYFYVWFQNNGHARCGRPARMGDVEGCFFASQVEIKGP